MSLIDDHFRTDGKRIEPCCIAMNSFACTELRNDFRVWRIFWNPTTSKNKDRMRGVPIHACPFCGSKLEYVDKLDSGQ